MMKIKGKVGHFRAEEINRVYGLLNSDQSPFTANYYSSVSGLDSKFFSGKNVPWATSKVGITLSEFTTEARILLAIICNHVSHV